MFELSIIDSRPALLSCVPFMQPSALVAVRMVESVWNQRHATVQQDGRAKSVNQVHIKSTALLFMCIHNCTITIV